MLIKINKFTILKEPITILLTMAHQPCEGPVVYEDERKILWIGGTSAMSVSDVFRVFEHYNPRRISFQNGYLHLELQNRADVDNAMTVHTSFFFGTKRLDVQRYNGNMRGRFYRPRYSYRDHHHYSQHHRHHDHDDQHESHHRRHESPKKRSRTPPPEEEENQSESSESDDNESDERGSESPRKSPRVEECDILIEEINREDKQFPPPPKHHLQHLITGLATIRDESKKVYWESKMLLIDLVTLTQEK